VGRFLRGGGVRKTTVATPVRFGKHSFEKFLDSRTLVRVHWCLSTGERSFVARNTRASPGAFPKVTPMSATLVTISPARPALRRSNDRRARLVRLLAVSGLAVLGAVALSTRFADADTSVPSGASTPGTAGVVVVVQPGDTLWSVARALQPSGDVRPLVARLARVHGHSSVQAGDRLRVPAELLGSGPSTP
jgi:LysM repeat protein